MRPLSILVAALIGCGGSDGPPNADLGSLCGCVEVDDELQCCFGNGTCEPSEDGPDVCVCDEGARGALCATPPPGVQDATMRSCSGDDPGCDAPFEFVMVEAFDDCVDLDAERFEGFVVRAGRDRIARWPISNVPLAAFVHGAGQDHGDYYDLLEHIAALGFVVLSIDGTADGSVVQRANRLLSAIECFGADDRFAENWDRRVALLGHSRGGAAAATAAQAIGEGVAAPGVTVQAVVALAPSSAGLFPLVGDATPAFLAVQGSRDPDTTGAALAWYDLASTGLLKSLVWIYGATHQRFHQGFFAGGTGEVEATITGPQHWDAARAYIGGFLRWRLLGGGTDRSYFTGDAAPASVAGIATFTAFLDQRLPRFVVDDFEAGFSGTASGVDAADVGPFETLDPPWSAAHRSFALRVAWSDAAAGPAVAFPIDPLDADVRDFEALSFRVSRPLLAGGLDCEAVDPTPGALRIALSDGTASHAIPTSELGPQGEVPVPDHFPPQTFGAWLSQECHGVDFMRTVRIPTASYAQAGVDLSRVESVVLYFDATPSGVLIVDDLEFGP